MRQRHLDSRRRLLALALAGVLIALAALWVGAAAAKAAPMGFNQKGNVLIADQFNNRVIEVARDGRIVWHFGTGSPVAGAKTVVAPNDAQRIPGGRTLIAGTGAPAGATGYPAGGANDSRVLIVNKAGKIVWQYGKAGVTGTGANLLNTPVQATYLKGGRVLITDQAQRARDHGQHGQEDRLAVRPDRSHGQRPQPAQQPEQRRTADERPHPHRRRGQQPRHRGDDGQDHRLERQPPG